VKFLILDDHPVIQESLKISLSSLPGEHSIHFAGTLKEALTSISETFPEFLIVDHELPDGKGLKAVSQAKALNPGVKVVLFTQIQDAEVIRHYIVDGVKALIHKSDSFSEINQAIIHVLDGKSYTSPAMSEVLAAQSGPALTQRELEVVRELALGKTNKQISDSLKCSEETVKTHKANLMRKLRMNSTVEVCVWAIKKKLV
jgi:DNA-binding NarL/FixJ family response regulator